MPCQFKFSKNHSVIVIVFWNAIGFFLFCRFVYSLYISIILTWERELCVVYTLVVAGIYTRWYIDETRKKTPDNTSTIAKWLILSKYLFFYMNSCMQCTIRENTYPILDTAIWAGHVSRRTCDKQWSSSICSVAM